MFAASAWLLRVTVKNLLVILSITLVPILGLADEHCQLMVCGPEMLLLPSTPEGPEAHSGFFVDCDLLQDQPKWSGSERFPLELGAVSRRAALSLVKEQHLPLGLDLQFVRVQRVSWPTNVTTNAISNGWSTNQDFWIVVFWFSAGNSGGFVTKVVLLNGAYARERDIGLEAARARDGVRTIIGRSEKMVRTERSAINLDPLLESVDTPISHVQWDPSAEAFPANVDQFVQNGAAYLREKNLLNGERPKLISIVFFWRVPSKAIYARGLKLDDNFHHWYCDVRFVAGDGNKAFDVYLLLDGTVVRTSLDN